MEIVFGHRTVSRLHEGPLGLYIDSYLEILNEQGFSHESAEEQVRLIVGFSRWLDENGYKAEDVSQEKADGFLKCRYLHLRPQRGDSAALHRLSDLLCRMGVIYLHAAPVTPCDRLLGDFRQYPAKERALCEKTLKTYLPYVRKFLCEKFDGAWSARKQLARSAVTTGWRSAFSGERRPNGSGRFPIPTAG